MLNAAELHLCRREPIAPTRRYVGKPTAAPKTNAAALRALAVALEQANEARQAAGRVDVLVAQNDETRLVLDVVRPEAPTCDLVRDARGAVQAKAWTRLVVDRVLVEKRKDGVYVLWISTLAPELLAAYRRAAGEALFDDASLFAATSALSLRALQRNGKATLKKARAGLARLRDARVVVVVWDSGHEETIAIAGRNVLAALEREELASHGLVLSARVRLDFDDGPVDVTLRAPNIVHWTPSCHDDAVRAFLGGLSLDAPSPENIVTLAPHDHAAWRWRCAFGDTLFEDLLAKGMFAESTSRALAHPGLPSAGRIMLAFPLGKSGKYHVVPEEGFDAEPWLATEKDLVTYRLDLEKLAARLQRELGAEGDPPRVIERGTLVDLGTVTVGTALVRLYLRDSPRARSRGGRTSARAERAGAQPVLVVPRGTALGTGCAEVEMETHALAGPLGGVLAAVARAIGVAATLDAWARAPKGTRLAGDKKTGRVWLDGVDLVALAESTRTLVRVLLAAGGKPVAGMECDRKLSGARSGAGAAKKAKMRFVSGVEKSFALAGRAVPERGGGDDRGDEDGVSGDGGGVDGVRAGSGSGDPPSVPLTRIWRIPCVSVVLLTPLNLRQTLSIYFAPPSGRSARSRRTSASRTGRFGSGTERPRWRRNRSRVPWRADRSRRR